jgi:predicted nucleotide-binding protein
MSVNSRTLAALARTSVALARPRNALMTGAMVSSPSCFIAYGFKRSALEMEILRALLLERRIETYEAAGELAPAQQVFCQKICSKIIQSQFCIVLVNNESVRGVQMTNANVYMEYGLMLGFNKCVIPFQHEDYELPFNVSGLDTIKYNNASFKAKARGVKMGRKPKLTPHQQREAIKRRERGEPMRDIARSYNVSHTTISRLSD